MTLRGWLEILGAGFSLIGVLIGVYGTYLLTKFYHPYATGGFAKSVMRMLWLKASRRFEEDERKTKVESALGAMRKENKAKSLTGIYWVFIGFIFQTVGALLITIDVGIANFVHNPSSIAG